MIRYAFLSSFVAVSIALRHVSFRQYHVNERCRRVPRTTSTGPLAMEDRKQIP